MINETESSKRTLDSSWDTIELRHGWAENMDSQINDIFAGKLTHQSVKEHIKLATEPILQQVERLCGVLPDRTDFHTAGNREATNSRREELSTSSVDNWFDTENAGNLSSVHHCIKTIPPMANQLAIDGHVVGIKCY